MKSTLTLAAVAAASLALAACGQKAEEAAPAEEATVEGAAEETMGAAEEAAPAEEATTEEAAPAEGEAAEAPAAEEAAPAAE